MRTLRTLVVEFFRCLGSIFVAPPAQTTEATTASPSSTWIDYDRWPRSKNSRSWF